METGNCRKMLDKITDTIYEYPSSNKDIQTFLGLTNRTDDYENKLYSRIRNILVVDIEDTSVHLDAFQNIATAYPSSSTIHDVSYNLVPNDQTVNKYD